MDEPRKSSLQNKMENFPEDMELDTLGNSSEGVGACCSSSVGNLKLSNGTGNGNDQLQSKENLRVTISDPNPSERRHRWINDKIRMGNKLHNRTGISHSKSGSKGADSGYHGDSLPQLNNTNITISSSNSQDSPFSRSSAVTPRQFTYNSEKCQRKSKDRVGSGKLRLRNTSSLNSNYHDYMDGFMLNHSTSNNHDPDNEEDDLEANFGLSRQNGIRHSMKHHHNNQTTEESPTESAYSISSESDASQNGDLEPPLDGPGFKTSRDKARKHSIFFSTGWNEEDMSQRYKDVSPSSGSILEAAWNGEVSLIEEILSRNPDAVLANVNSSDMYGRTPLHLAAACGHYGAVELLVQKGANVEVMDFQHKATPLMCAAGCGSLAVVELLLTHGASVNAGYECGKTALMWAVQAESVECTRKLLESGALQNPPVAYSETAIHIAAALGNLPCLQLCLDFGADVTLIKGSSRSTALHLAAEEGSLPCIRQLLKAGASHSAKDARGHTPLHISAACDTDATAMLLEAGADPNIVDTNGRTPLHCAVARGSRAAECVRLLIEAQAEVNQHDFFGYTPLHLAGVNESSQCASILITHGADVTAKTKAGTTALSVLVRRIPDVVRFLVERLDSAITVDHDPGDPDCEVRLDFRAIVPNTEKRVPGKNNKVPERTAYYHQPRRETEFLTCLLAAGNKKILAHPLSEAFLHLKWKCVRKFFWASLCFQIALVLLYTAYVVNVYLIQCPYDKDAAHFESPSALEATTTETTATATDSTLNSPFDTGTGLNFEESGRTKKKNDSKMTENNRRRRSHKNYRFTWFSFDPRIIKSEKLPDPTTTTPTTTDMPRLRNRILFSQPSPNVVESDKSQQNETTTTAETGEENFCQLGTSLFIVWCLLISFTSVMAIKELFQAFQAPWAYIISSENWGQFLLIVSICGTAWPASGPGLHLSYWQYPAAAFGIFLAYSLMLLQVGRQPALGLYVQMLGKVAANFGLFILAYACLLIAFALAFCVIFPGNPAYSSPPLALMKVLTMMVGEVDYEEQFYGNGDDKRPIPYPITAHVLHSAFVIIVTIVLMNLLVGLAVHDIQGLQKGAKLNRLSRQTALICRLESFIFSKRLQSCLPRSIGICLQKNALLVPSSYNWSYYFRPNDPRDKRLPKELKQAALRLAAARYTIKHSSKIHSDSKNSQQQQLVYTGSVAEVNFRKLDQRMDKLQKQIDGALKTFNDNMEKMIKLLEKTEAHLK